MSAKSSLSVKVMVTSLTILEIVCFCEIYLLLSDISHYQLVEQVVGKQNKTPAIDLDSIDVNEEIANSGFNLQDIMAMLGKNGVKDLAKLMNITDTSEKDLNDKRAEIENNSNQLLIKSVLTITFTMNILVGILTILATWCYSVEERRRKQRTLLRITKSLSWWWAVAKICYTAILMVVVLAMGKTVPVVGIKTTLILLITYIGYLYSYIKLTVIMLWENDKEENRDDVLYKQVASDDILDDEALQDKVKPDISDFVVKFT